MSNRNVVVTTKVLNSDVEVKTAASALSPREKRAFGLTRSKKVHKSQEKKIDTTHLRWC